ncbi:MAG TPA: RIO1 family regulatory kinase/ATPase [Planctomycetota bacterium]|nr:RIO1 family regulatory kinase/ATPase [Planctomycetota bacterium]
MSNEVPIPEAAAELRRRRLITRIHRPPLCSGKEATVYRCSAHPATGRPDVALKIYRPLTERAFRADTIYRHGRRTGSSRVDRAIDAGSTFGLRCQARQWQDWEKRTLALLRAAGADVPEPIALVEGALLMEFIGDDEAAPKLHEAAIEADDLAACWLAIRRTVRCALRVDRVHADLSAYNVLWWRGRPIVIDWPQAVDPRENDAAERLLRRDLANIAGWFARRGLDIDHRAEADACWSAWLMGEPLS